MCVQLERFVKSVWPPRDAMDVPPNAAVRSPLPRPASAHAGTAPPPRRSVPTARRGAQIMVQFQPLEHDETHFWGPAPPLSAKIGRPRRGWSPRARCGPQPRYASPADRGADVAGHMLGSPDIRSLTAAEVSLRRRGFAAEVKGEVQYDDVGRCVPRCGPPA